MSNLKDNLRVETTYLTAVSYVTIKRYEESHWTVSQKFIKLGKPITVIREGFSRANAIENFKMEVEYYDKPMEQSWFDALCQMIMRMAILYDWTVQTLEEMKKNESQS